MFYRILLLLMFFSFSTQGCLFSVSDVGEISEILIKYGIEPSRAIYRAASNGDLHSLKKLIEYGVSPFECEGDMNLMDCACNTNINNIEMVKYIYEELNISPNRNPLDQLIKRPQQDFYEVDYFLSKGYSFSEDAFFKLFSERPKKIPSIGLIENFIERGLDVSCIKNIHYSKEVKFIFGFIFCDEKIDSSQLDPSIKNMTIYKKINSDSMLSQYLFNLGINVDQEISFIKTEFKHVNGKYLYCIYNKIILVAIANNDIELLQDLISIGVDVNLSGKEAILDMNELRGSGYRLYRQPMDITPLKLAVKEGHKKIVELLLESGAKI